jgi:hypothetical protein
VGRRAEDAVRLVVDERHAAVARDGEHTVAHAATMCRKKVVAGATPGGCHAGAATMSEASAGAVAGSRACDLVMMVGKGRCLGRESARKGHDGHGA